MVKPHPEEYFQCSRRASVSTVQLHMPRHRNISNHKNVIHVGFCLRACQYIQFSPHCSYMGINHPKAPTYSILSSECGCSSIPSLILISITIIGDKKPSISSQQDFLSFPDPIYGNYLFSVKSFHQLLQLGGHCCRQGGGDDLFPISSISFSYLSFLFLVSLFS